MSRLRVALLALVASGCKKLDPAPRDIDGLLHWFWESYEDADDEQIHEATRNLLSAAAKQEELPLKGTITRLAQEDIEMVGVTGQEASEADGLMLLNTFRCGIGKLDPILYYKDQSALYEGTYEEYERDYTSSLADYKARTVPEITWDVRYVSKVVGPAYEARPTGGLRWVPEIDEEVSPHGPVILARTWMPAPATYDGEAGNSRFDQDYQIEVYVRQGSGDLLHLYGIWREAEYAGFSTESEGTRNILLNNLVDWDETTAGYCASGLP